MQDKIFIRPMMSCPVCHMTMLGSHDIYALRTTQKAGMGVYPMDLVDEAEGISYSCPKCNKTYDVIRVEPIYEERK